jgi:transposase
MNSAPDHWQAVRRRHAWQLKPQGWSQRQIAVALGVSEGAVSRWMTRARTGGPEALRPRRHPGAARRLAPEPLARLPDLLPRGADTYGLRGQVGTRGRVAAIIRLECGLGYQPGHVGRLLKALRWSPPKPARRARQRDEVAMARGRQQTWPALKKGRRPSSR